MQSLVAGKEFCLDASNLNVLEGSVWRIAFSAAL